VLPLRGIEQERLVLPGRRRPRNGPSGHLDAGAGLLGGEELHPLPGNFRMLCLRTHGDAYRDVFAAAPHLLRIRTEAVSEAFTREKVVAREVGTGQPCRSR